DRDQLFAEGVDLFRAGVAWWPDAEFEQRCIAAEQEARFEEDAWEEPIGRYLATLDPKKTTILEIATGALDFERERPRSRDDIRGTPINRLTPADQHRIGGVLTHLGWEPKRNKHGRWWGPKTA